MSILQSGPLLRRLTATGLLSRSRSLLPSFRSVLRGHHGGLLLILVGTALGAAHVARIDYPWTLALHRSDWKPLSSFMARSVFEGEGIGGSDAAVALIALSLILYGLSCWRPGKARLARVRPYLGFVFTYGVVSCFLMTHSLKWIVGRARPSLVLKKGMDFTHWFQFGPHLPADGSSLGSFPSGHTGLVFAFMALAYVWFDRCSASCRAPTGGGLLGLLALGYAFLMAAARSMSLSHWISDGLFTIALSWVVMHVLFHWVLRVPCQIRYAAAHRGRPFAPRWWELGFCCHAALAAAGLTLGGVGMRTLSLSGPDWLPVAGFAGLAGMVFFARRAWRLRCRALARLPSPRRLPSVSTAAPPKGAPSEGDADLSAAVFPKRSVSA